MLRHLLAFGVLLHICTGFQIIIDLNTYNASELAFASKPTPPGILPFTANGTWTIEENSKGINESQWAAAISAVGSAGSVPSVFSEDNPGSTSDCTQVRLANKGSLTATFQYHETGGVPATMLNASEISAASKACGNAGVVILTRAFWPNSAWRTKVVDVLSHPLLFGVAMEFNPDDYGKRSEGEFVKTVLAAGKRAFFLLPFRETKNTTEDVIGDAIHSFSTLVAAEGASLDDDRVYVVLARYDEPHVAIQGSTNSISSALWRAKTLQPKGCINAGAECDDRHGKPARCGRCCNPGPPVPHSVPRGQTYYFCP